MRVQLASAARPHRKRAPIPFLPAWLVFLLLCKRGWASPCSHALPELLEGFTSALESEEKILEGDLTIRDGCSFKLSDLRYGGESATVFWWGKAVAHDKTEVKLSPEVLILNSQRPGDRSITLRDSVRLPTLSKLIARDAFSKEVLAWVSLPHPAPVKRATDGQEEEAGDLSEDLQKMLSMLDSDASNREPDTAAPISEASTGESEKSSDEETVDSSVGYRKAGISRRKEAGHHAKEHDEQGGIKVLRDVDEDVDAEREQWRAVLNSQNARHGASADRLARRKRIAGL